MRYTIDYKTPLNHFINVKIEVNVTDSEEFKNFQLPAWRPGRYQLGNFAKNIRNLKAYDDEGNLLIIRKQTKDLWQVELKGATTFRLEYEFFAHKMDAGSSWLDDEQLYINPVNCLMYIPEYEPGEHTLRVMVPTNYKIACGLPQRETGVFEASDFQELADSPLMASAGLREWSYTEGRTTYHLWFMGEFLPEKDRTIEVFKAFTKAQTEVMGELPLNDYHFMFHLLPYPHYHGVEHRASTVITLGPDTKIREETLYKHFVGVSSHELFHAWNVCRLRPAEMQPYNFSKEAYFDTGFIAEGVTTYYGDLFLARSGFFKASEYIEELNNNLKRFGMHYAGRHTTLAESSYDLWLDGYEAGVPDRKMSIYNEGALAALTLDLLIREKTNDEASLDTVMVALYNRFAGTGFGYRAHDYREEAEKVVGESLEDYFNGFIYGNFPLQEYITPLLDRLGLSIDWVQTDKLDYSHRYGFRLGKKDNEGKLVHIAPDSSGEGKLSLEDEIVAVNGRKYIKEEDLNFFRGNLTLTVFRNNVLKTIDLTENGALYYRFLEIGPKEDAAEEEFSRMKKWLRGR